MIKLQDLQVKVLASPSLGKRCVSARYAKKKIWHVVITAKLRQRYLKSERSQLQLL